MNSTKIEPKYIIKSNPRVGLIALASDFMIERDFIKVIKDRDIDLFVNRIECYNPLTKDTANDSLEEGEDDVKSSCPLHLGLHTCYNGQDNEQRPCKGKRISKTWSQFGLGAETRPHEAGIGSNPGSAIPG